MGSYYTIDWAPIDYDYNGNYLSKNNDPERYVLNSSQIAFGSDFEPSFGFGFLGYYACFVQLKKSDQVFLRTFRCFGFNAKTGNASDVTNFIASAIKREMTKNLEKLMYKGNSHLGDMVLTDLTDTRRLIAIFYDFHLFQEDNVITYCPAQSFFFNLGVSVFLLYYISYIIYYIIFICT